MTLQHSASGRPLGRTGRVLLAGWSLFLLTGFALALWLEPDPRGFGTHQALGLPPCTIQFLYDIPCPSCGMTTSFSHFVRGELLLAARANAGGLMLALVCALQVPWCWISAYRGRLWLVSQPEFSLMWLMGMLSTVCVLDWARRVWMS